MIAFIKQHWLIILIVAVAAFCRLYRISDYMEFLGDQGRDVVIVRNFLKNHDPFFIGPQTSVGNMYLGPYYYYLFVAPGLLLAGFNPVGPSIVVAILGVLTVFLLFKFVSKWFGIKAAYITSFLYAISPVVIKYSNFSWNPNVMPLFALLFFYYILNSNLLLAAFAFVVCLNSHFLALLLIPTGGLIYFWKFYTQPKKRTSLIRGLIIAIVVFILSLTPQVLFDIKHNGQNINAFLSFFTHRETTVNLKAYKAIPEIAPLFIQINTRLLAGKNAQVGLYVSILFFVLLIIETYRQIRQKKPNAMFIFLSLWYLIGLVGLALYKQHIYDHYFAFVFPVVFILFGYLLSKTTKFIYIPVLIGLTVFSILENPFRWSAPKQLATTLAIDESIIKSANGQPFNFALLAKMNYDPGYRYFFSEKKAPVELLQEKVTNQLYVVCEPFQIDCNPINNPEWGIAAFGWAKIDTQWEINGIKIFRLVHTQ